MIRKILDYIKRIYTEMRKVTWPTRRELINSTIVVIVISAIVAVIIYFFDIIFSTGLALIVK
ncbi:MAG: preprotein translocase subunit SecE [bacterium]